LKVDCDGSGRELKKEEEGESKGKRIWGIRLGIGSAKIRYPKNRRDTERGVRVQPKLIRLKYKGNWGNNVIYSIYTLKLEKMPD